MICGYGVVAFRDPCAIRPLCFGVRETADGLEYMVASESVALDALGFELTRDLEPGEAIIITLGGEVHSRQCFEEPRYAPCIFEYVYLARPDSIIDDVSVYKARLRMGEALAEKIIREWPDHDIDVVIPIPETSRTACLPLAYDLRVKYREGFIKNRYVARTFIMPGQTQRMRSVRRKLNAIGLEFEGKNVLLVDDSIVRGTTSRQIIQQARDAGAQRVYFASAAPPVRYQNVYGIDMPVMGRARRIQSQRGGRRRGHWSGPAHLPVARGSSGRGAARKSAAEGFRHVLLHRRVCHRGGVLELPGANRGAPRGRSQEHQSRGGSRQRGAAGSGLTHRNGSRPGSPVHSADRPKPCARSGRPCLHLLASL